MKDMNIISTILDDMYPFASYNWDLYLQGQDSDAVDDIQICIYGALMYAYGVISMIDKDYEKEDETCLN